MKLFQIIGLCLVTATLVVATTFTDCGSKGATIHSVTISNCKSEPCALKLGEAHSMKVVFTPVENTTRLVSLNYLNMLGKRLVFPPADFCKVVHVKCPTVAGAQQLAVVWVRFDPVYPAIDAEMQWLVIDEMGFPFLCIDLSLKLTETTNSLKPLSSSGDSLADLDTQTAKHRPVQIKWVPDDRLFIN